MRCLKCHRPLKREGVNGLGPVCAKGVKAAQPVERDLFGYDIAGATAQAQDRIRVMVAGMVRAAHLDTAFAFAAARRRLGVWA